MPINSGRERRCRGVFFQHINSLTVFAPNAIGKMPVQKSIPLCGPRSLLLRMAWLVVLTCLLASGVQGQSYDFTYLDQVMKDSIDYWGVRGASIAFFDRNSMTEPIVRGYGRTASGATSAPVSADTAFMLASVSKVFAGTAVLKLVDLGILSSIDDDICNVYGEITSACRNPHFPNIPVTWRMLVTHRSSFVADIPSYPTQDGNLEPSFGPTGGYFGLAAGQATCPMEDVVGFYRDILIDKESETVVGAELGVNWYQLAQQELGGMWQSNYRPGGRAVYSNFAVGYIAALVELATNQTFPDFTQQYIFDPLGMNSTAWFRRDLPSNVQVAMPVETNRRGTRFHDIGHYCFIHYACGSLYSTAVDLAKFLESMLDLGVPALWSSKENALVCLEQNAKGQPVSDCVYGANWILIDNDWKGCGGEWTWLDAFAHLDWTHGGIHNGWEAGVQTQILVLPRAGVYTVVLTNTDGNDELAPQMMAMELMDEVRGSSLATKRRPGMALLLPLVVAAVSVVVLWFL